MANKILIDATHKTDIRVALINEKLLEDFDSQTTGSERIKGNIYLAKIARIEPSLQAAFIEYGNEKNGFLPFSEIHPDYYILPNNDKKHLNKILQALERPSIDNADKEELSKAEKKAPDSSENNNLENLEHQEIFTPKDGMIDLDPAEELTGNRHFETKHKIQEVLKKGQIILVQADKEERGSKGASFTTYISLAGRYSVLMPNNDKQSGISRRITNIEERDRLRNIINDLNSSEFSSVILRTGGENKTRTDIKYDYDYLVRLWNSVREKALSSKAPAFIHAEGDLIKRCLRDMYNNTISEILIQGEEAFSTTENFLKMLAPYNPPKIKLYKSKTPIFIHHKIENQILSLYNQRVDLRSGGYIIINNTEALIAIDVNSGKATSEKNVEETAFKTNIEAAHEIARQLRLRDLSGLIIIDFIDMNELRHKKLVERTFYELMSRDKAKTQIIPISSFGLLQVSRQRLKPDFLQSYTIDCSHCNGRGIVKSEEVNAITILRTIEAENIQSKFDIAKVYTNGNIILYLLNNKKEEISKLEISYNIKIEFVIDSEAQGDRFAIEKLRETKKQDKQALVDHEEVATEMIEEFPYEQIAAEEKEIEKRLAERALDENSGSSRIKTINKDYSKNRKRKNFNRKDNIRGKKPKKIETSSGTDKSSGSLLKGLWQKIMG